MAGSAATVQAVATLAARLGLASAADGVERPEQLRALRELGIGAEMLNRDGGAIALGHPLGATGARIVGKAASILKRDGGKYAIATQCIGGGQGIATLLESI